MTKFIIALLALQPTPFIDYAQAQFGSIANDYIIGKNSHPHITLAQFYAAEDQVAAIQNQLPALAQAYQIKPEFTGISSLLKSDGWWVEYSIKRNRDLLLLQKEVQTLLKTHQLELLNDVGDLYRPHMTLARLSPEAFILNLPASLPQSDYALAIGKADSYGQFFEIIADFR